MTNKKKNKATRGKDDVLAQYERKKPKLHVELMGDCVLIEGDSYALQFLADLTKDLSTTDEACGAQLHPRGTGSSFFKKDSPLGIFIHRADGHTHGDEPAKKTKKPTKRESARKVAP